MKERGYNPGTAGDVFYRRSWMRPDLRLSPGAGRPASGPDGHLLSVYTIQLFLIFPFSPESLWILNRR